MGGMVSPGLRLPAPAPVPPPPGFPVLGMMAPLVVAVILWQVTQSPFALLFAVLSPVMLGAGLLDAHRQRRRQRHRGAAERRVALGRLRTALHEEQLRLVRRLEDAVVPLAALLSGGELPPRLLPDEQLLLRLGRGDVASGIDLGVEAAGGGREGAAERELLTEAAVLRNAPLITDARLSIGFVGSDALTAAAARAWIGQVLIGTGTRPVPPPTARAAALLPPGCRVIVELRSPYRARLLRSPDPTLPSEFRPELLSAPGLATLQERAGVRPLLPERVSLRALRAEQWPTGPASGDPTGLAATFAVDRAGPAVLDLAADGPHAIIGGTTGSGKSELLLSWLVTLAENHPPERLSLLLFDFKGGSAFDPLAGLPHCAGLVTDLDGPQLDRAAVSLQAELAFRERALRTAGVRTAAESADLPTLVVVVDEFAAVVAARPALHDLFVDLAARGRTLGIHLILCTQRPSGVIRESLLANCALRICLRVVDAADSVAVIGTAAAAGIRPALPGRCFVARHGEPVQELQVAIAAAEEIAERVHTLALRGRPLSRPVWLNPLPAAVLLPDLCAGSPPTGGLLLGLLDRPEVQRQYPVRWSPQSDGPLLVVGANRSGRSTVLRTLLRQSTERVPVRAVPLDVEGAWDTIRGEEARPSGGVLLCDDADQILAALPADYQAPFLGSLAALLRRRSGARLVVTAGGLSAAPAGFRTVAGLFDARLVLRLVSRDEHLFSGGGPAYDPRLPPGGGWWNGHRIQVALAQTGPDEPGDLDEPGPSAPDQDPPAVTFAEATTWLLVTPWPARRAEQLQRCGVRTVRLAGRADPRQASPPSTVPTVLVGDLDSWQAQIVAYTSLSLAHPVIVEGASAAELRALHRRRELPPLLANEPDRVWLLYPERDVARARLDLPG